MSKLLRFAIAAALIGTAAPAVAADADWSKVAQALGKEGSVQPGGVYRVGLPRSDLHVTLDGVALKPGFALGGWLAFASMGRSTMVMGDLVLTESEIAPVIKKFESEGIKITALHNHLLRGQPATLYMHVLGEGDGVKLASALHDGLALSKTPLQAAAAASPAPAAAPAGASDLDTAAIDQAIGRKGKDNGGVYSFSVPRAKPVRDEGMEMPDAMGAATGINFQSTDGGKAAITGDFVLTANEVNPVIQALAQNGIEVTALHSHMLDEEPRLFFMHFWANDDTVKLAKGLRAALDKIDIKKG
jgi:hypothetical protein